MAFIPSTACFAKAAVVSAGGRGGRCGVRMGERGAAAGLLRRASISNFKSFMTTMCVSMLFFRTSFSVSKASTRFSSSSRSRRNVFLC